ncbi:ATP-binding protein [Arthrobacter sp. A5]|uniref:ATP-binding protein n=1 Tax=Arthrobacter sp. A5 TaxID=576926 RepID=UPI003DA9319B
MLLEVGADAAEGLYRLLMPPFIYMGAGSSAISERMGTSVGFDALMHRTLATATVDRLLHHAHVCQTSRDSIRLTQALAGKGVTPMS